MRVLVLLARAPTCASRPSATRARAHQPGVAGHGARPGRRCRPGPRLRSEVCKAAPTRSPRCCPPLRPRRGRALAPPTRSPGGADRAVRVWDDDSPRPRSRARRVILAAAAAARVRPGAHRRRRASRRQRPARASSLPRHLGCALRHPGRRCRRACGHVAAAGRSALGRGDAPARPGPSRRVDAALPVVLHRGRRRRPRPEPPGRPRLCRGLLAAAQAEVAVWDRPTWGFPAADLRRPTSRCGTAAPRAPRPGSIPSPRPTRRCRRSTASRRCAGLGAAAGQGRVVRQPADSVAEEVFAALARRGLARPPAPRCGRPALTRPWPPGRPAPARQRPDDRSAVIPLEYRLRELGAARAEVRRSCGSYRAAPDRDDGQRRRRPAAAAGARLRTSPIWLASTPTFRGTGLHSVEYFRGRGLLDVRPAVAPAARSRPLAPSVPVSSPPATAPTIWTTAWTRLPGRGLPAGPAGGHRRRRRFGRPGRGRRGRRPARGPAAANGSNRGPAFSRNRAPAKLPARYSPSSTATAWPAAAGCGTSRRTSPGSASGRWGAARSATTRESAPRPLRGGRLAAGHGGAPAPRGGGPDTFYVPTCNLLVRRSLYLDLGGLREDLRVGEDVDLCWRLRASGSYLVYLPRGRVRHKHRATWGDASAPGRLRHLRGYAPRPSSREAQTLPVGCRRRWPRSPRVCGCGGDGARCSPPAWPRRCGTGCVAPCVCAAAGSMCRRGASGSPFFAATSPCSISSTSIWCATTWCP